MRWDGQSFFSNVQQGRETPPHASLDQEDIPLFNRYMFIEMPSENADWLTVRRGSGVECVLGINGKPFPVPGHQIEQCIREFDSGAFDELRTVVPKIGIGGRIKIADGRVLDFYGIVTKADS